MESRPLNKVRSITSSLDMLRTIVESRDYQFDPALKQALVSQGSFAGFKDDALQIVPMSLNTFKALAAEHVVGGFGRLDQLRRSALERARAQPLQLNVGNTPKPRDANASIAAAEKHLAGLHAANLVLLNAISKTLIDIDDIARTKVEATRTRLASELISRIHATLSLNSPPYDSASKAEIKLVRG